MKPPSAKGSKTYQGSYVVSRRWQIEGLEKCETFGLTGIVTSEHRTPFSSWIASVYFPLLDRSKELYASEKEQGKKADFQEQEHIAEQTKQSLKIACLQTGEVLKLETQEIQWNYNRSGRTFRFEKWTECGRYLVGTIEETEERVKVSPVNVAINSRTLQLSFL